jgi:hypothetical protein
MGFHPITGWFGINNVIGWVGFNFPLVFLVGCGMDMKVIRFGYGWEWIGFFAISRPTPKFYGPFQVEERIGSLSYHLALPPQTHIHNVFHMLFLKEVCGHATRKTSAAATYQTRSSSSSSTRLFALYSIWMHVNFWSSGGAFSC